jgi:gliding motility-associated-like protein
MAGTYTLTVMNPATGCTTTSTVDVINGVPTASFTPDVLTGFAPQTVNFTNLSSGAISYSWSFGDGNSSTSTNPSNVFNSSGSYTVTLIASSGLCSDSAMAVIVVDDAFSIEVPNVFTPNNDYVNDVFTIKSKGVKSIEMQIFNRWGQLMYSFTGSKAGWDGMTDNGQKAPDGTYFYFIKATGFDGKEISKNGTVNLFR